MNEMLVDRSALFHGKEKIASINLVWKRVCFRKTTFNLSWIMFCWNEYKFYVIRVQLIRFVWLRRLRPNGVELICHIALLLCSAANNAISSAIEPQIGHHSGFRIVQMSIDTNRHYIQNIISEPMSIPDASIITGIYCTPHFVKLYSNESESTVLLCYHTQIVNISFMSYCWVESKV